MISAAQLRAARGLLDWTRADLAKAADVSPETIKNIEHGTFRPQESTTDSIVRAFALHDVEFTENEGVRKKKELVKTFSGVDGFKDFLEDIYATVKDKTTTLYQCNFSDDLFVQFMGPFVDKHVERMAGLASVKAKCLTRSGDQNFVSSDYCEYRWLPEHQNLTVPYYLYDEYVALMVAKEDKSISFVVVRSVLLVDTYRKHFEELWTDAIKPSAQIKS